MKLKIKPSARIKKHHLLINGKKADVEKIILDYIGILGWAKAAPTFIQKKSKLILSVERKAVSQIRAAFELSQNKVKILKVSGTLKGLEK